MKPSKIYNYAMFITEKERIDMGLNLAKTSLAKNFLMYEIAVIPNTFIKPTIKNKQLNLKLTGQHLSFYEFQDGDYGALSQYHYTAYFKNDTKQYRAHIYFNEKDELATSPQFAIKDSKGNYQKIEISDEVQNQLKLLAISNSSSFISKLRTKHKDQVTSDTNEFSELEESLSEASKKLPEKTGEYLIGIKKLSFFAKTFYQYHYQEYYKNISHTLDKITTRINNKPSVEQKQSHTIEIDETLDIDDESLSEPSSKTSDRTKVKSLSNEFSQAKKIFSQYSIDMKAALKTKPLHEVKLIQSIKLLHRAEAATREIDILLEDESYIVNIKDFEVIRCLMSDIFKAKNKLLTTLLLFKQYNAAQTLVGPSGHGCYSMSHQTAERFFKLALKKSNPEMLEFIFKNSAINVNHIKINHNADKTKKSQQMSAVHYCYATDNKLYPKLECLKILIQHDANVMEPIGREQTSIAALIVQSKSPLIAALGSLLFKSIISLMIEPATWSGTENNEFQTLVGPELLKDIGQTPNKMSEMLSQAGIQWSPAKGFSRPGTGTKNRQLNLIMKKLNLGVNAKLQHAAAELHQKTMPKTFDDDLDIPDLPEGTDFMSEIGEGPNAGIESVLTSKP